MLLRAEGYYKRYTDVLIGRLETDAERAARVGRYDFPFFLASSVPIDPIITTVPTNDGRGHAYGFDLFVSRSSAPASARLMGWASYTWGKAERDAYGYRYPFEYRPATCLYDGERVSPDDTLGGRRDDPHRVRLSAHRAGWTSSRGGGG